MRVWVVYAPAFIPHIIAPVIKQVIGVVYAVPALEQNAAAVFLINFFRAVLKSGNNVTAENNLTVENNLTSKNNFTPIHLVDLPGYGYAKTSKTNRRIWAKFIEEYLLSSPNLKFVCQLVDMRHAPMDSDKKFFAWLVENNGPVLVIATKADKLSRAQRSQAVLLICRTLAVQPWQVVPFSSISKMGKEELTNRILGIGEKEE